jgi:hypothetical protein
MATAGSSPPEHHAPFVYLAERSEVGAPERREGRRVRFRDIVRAVQQARRDAGLDVSDRISLTVTGGQLVWEATVAHQALIVEETLAAQFGSAPQLEALPSRDDVVETAVGDGQPVRIKVMKL